MDATMSEPSAKTSGFNAAVKNGITPQFLLTLVIAVGGAIFTYAKITSEFSSTAKQVEQLQKQVEQLQSKATTVDIALARADLYSTYVTNELKKMDTKIDRIADAVGAKKL